ncbi:multiple wing hairs isoform X2 [Anticarsia gemmatalis]
MANSGGWSEEPVSKDKQRPPIYNPEDYVTSLKKWGKKTGGASLYDLEAGQDVNKARTLPNQGSKDFRNPCLSGGEEMTLRQFGTPSELLTKLRADLRLSFPSFVQEFSCEPLDGVTLLLELLRNVQLSQSGDGARGPPAVRRRPLLDELACLQCLWSCCSRYPDCVRRLVSGSNGVYTLTVCIMSTVNKSRVLALQLLTKACYPPAKGHSMVSEALSTLRLRYGEPVRFRFLVGMLQSAGGSGDLQAAGLSFINALLSSAPTPQRKLYIQAELEQAGFDIVTLKKMVAKLPSVNEHVTTEIAEYERQLIDIDSLSEKASEAQREKDDLRHKLDLLEKRVKILQEEKGILLSLEKCLKEKCCELQEEVSSLRSEHGNSNRKKPFAMKKKNSVHKNRDESSPPEDEGISSSERSLSPEGDPQRESMVYEVFNVKNETYDLMRNKRTLHKKHDNKNKDIKTSDEEEETTIDEVIQELRNIVNHAESEQYAKDAFTDDRSSRCNQTSEINVPINALECKKHREEKEDSITSTRHSIQIKSKEDFADDSVEDDQESEIVPTKIVPHPPRKSKSLLHLFVPPVDQGLLYKPPDLYDDNFYSSDEGSDSLLSASKYNNNKKVSKKPSGSSFDFHECRAVFNAATDRKDENRPKRSRTRSREESRRTSIKRSESFQTSEKGSRQREYIDSMFYTETHASLVGMVPLQRSNSKCSRVDEIVNLIESKKLTKSLDRIDEGLNSMVDIVMLSEPKKPAWPYERRQRSCSRTNSDAGKESPLIPITRSNSRLTNIHRYESKTCPKDDAIFKMDTQKFYMTQAKLSPRLENQAFNSSTFLVKRGHSNAGFYSGPHMLRDAPASMTSLVINGTHSHADLKRTLSPMGSASSKFGAHKVLDMPSGLY